MKTSLPMSHSSEASSVECANGLPARNGEMCRPSVFKRIVLWITLSTFILQPIAATAQVVSASTGNYRPKVGAAQNGIPVVQITAPSGAGVSRNQYYQYSPTAQGVVLNNSQVVVQTQLAGFIEGNANLAGGSARIILNEVTSNLPSNLRGFTEVGGSRAEVIIANPNGITCNGCGFINTSRGVLTTGTPVFGAGGSLDAFRVSGGNITIEGAGLNGSNTEQIDLIARAVQINAAFWGQNLNVIAGANQVAYADLATTTIAGTGAAPAVAIDVAALGGMYANKIRLVGTEAGVGVVNAGTLAAQAGDLSIDSAGRITLTGTTQASGRIDLSAQQDISNSGTTYAQGAAQVTSQGQITNTRTLATQGNLTLTAASINSSGVVAAGMASDGSFGLTGDLALNATGSLAATGSNLAGRSIAFTGSTLNLANSQSRSNGTINLTATSGDIDHRNADLLALGDVTLSAAGTINNSNGKLRTAGSLSLSTGSSYTHSADSTLRGDTGIRLASAADLTLTSDLNTLGLLQLSATGTLTNSASQVGDFITLSAGTLNNNGVIAAQKDLTANVSGRLSNGSNKLLYAGRDQRLYVNELVNAEDGSIYAGNDLIMQKDAAGNRSASVTNQIGTIEAARDLIIRSNALINQGSNPTLLSRSSSDEIRGYVTACPGGGGGCNASGTNAAGETVWSSAWGFAIPTAGEVSAYFTRNPLAPTSATGLVAPTFLALLTANRSDSHEREGGWKVWLTRSEQYLEPGAVIKSGKLLAGRDFVFDGSTLDNIASQIDATRDVNLSGSALTNQGQNLQTTNNYYSGNYLLSAGRHDLMGPLSTSTTIQTTGAVPSTIKAGRALTGNLSASLSNDARARPATPAPTAPTSTDPGPLIRIPASGAVGLTTLAAPTDSYLIETNPLYAQRGNFISSDYFLKRLGLNPQTVEKRLGDAAYEQNLVRDQIFALTGRRIFTNSSSEMAQYQELMDNATAANEAFHFTLGVSLTAAQVTQLTSDIVWLVEQRVTLPDGSSQKVLVPQVYLSRLTRDDLSPEGALIAANSLQLVAPEMANSGRMIAGSRIDIAALNLNNSGTIQSTQTDSVITLTAVNDLTNAGGTIAGGTVNLAAGNNLINRADRFDRTTALDGGQLDETVVGAVGRIIASGDATLTAGNKLSFQGGELDAGGNARLSAQGNLDLGTAVKSSTIALSGDRGYSLSGTQTEHTGSRVSAKGSVTLEAGNNLDVTASTVAAGTSLSATAGGAITIGTASEQNQYRVDMNKGFDHVQSDTQMAKGSTLSAGTDLSLNAGRELTLEAATVRAKQDVTLASVGDLSIVASRSTVSNQSQHKTGSGSDSATLYDQSVQGSIVDAGRNLSVSAGNAQAPGNTPANLVVQGSALAAGNDLKLASTGDLALLAATSQRVETIQRTTQTKKKLETLDFELEQNRVLLSTLTAGNSIDLNVGGNLAAQVGTTDSEGKLQADRMTVDGVIKGSDRQQVSVSVTDDKKGSIANSPTSKVLGDLNARGIRSGATDNLSPEAIQTGQAAVSALINSGLLTIKNAPGVQAALNAPTPNGSALTYTDTSGKVTLTVAGQSKVQAVYSQLKLTETFAVKNFADQQTAQIVTLIAAIVLTICTAGAGAVTLGAFLAGAGTTSAVMINAAVVGMLSTMAGQLAGGASFDQAFQAGVKAGATSALTAGVAYGVSDAMGLNPQLDASGNVMKDSVTGNVVYQTTAGAEYAKLSVLDKLGDSRFWTVTGAKVATSGIAAAANGGDFKQAASVSFITNMASMAYQSTVGYVPNAGPGKNPENPIYLPESNGQQPANTFGNNVIGLNKPESFFSQGGSLSRALNFVPFVNATGGLHDYIFNSDSLGMNAFTNVGTMLPAAAVAIPASLNDPSYNWMLNYQPPTPNKDKKP